MTGDSDVSWLIYIYDSSTLGERERQTEREREILGNETTQRKVQGDKSVYLSIYLFIYVYGYIYMRVYTYM